MNLVVSESCCSPAKVSGVRSQKQDLLRFAIRAAEPITIDRGVHGASPHSARDIARALAENLISDGPNCSSTVHL